MNRRFFFGTLLGAFVGAKVAPDARPVWGYSGGAHIGAIAGGFRAIDVGTADKDFLETATLSREQVARWFDVPSELISDAPTWGPYADKRRRLARAVERMRRSS